MWFDDFIAKWKKYFNNIRYNIYIHKQISKVRRKIRYIKSSSNKQYTNTVLYFPVPDIKYFHKMANKLIKLGYRVEFDDYSLNYSRFSEAYYTRINVYW